MSAYKTYLKLKVAGRTDNVMKDCRTFLAAKSQSKITVKLVRKGEIGGGNLLCALGLFSVLSLLSKVFVLTKNFDIYIESNKKTGDRLGRTNETDAFAEFVEFIQDAGIDLGLSNDKRANKEVWRKIRDELSHMSWPAYSISSVEAKYSTKNLDELESNISDSGTPFMNPLVNGKRLPVLSVDRFNIILPKIVKLLHGHIDKCDDINVEKTYHWIG